MNREWDVIDRDGNARRYSSDDFDEIFNTADEHEMRRHLQLGWLLLEETVGPGEGSERLELEERAQGGETGGNPRTVPVWHAEDVVHYVLGYLKHGTTGTSLD